MQIQVTLSTENGKYKPITTLIDVASVKDFNTNQKEYIRKAKIRMCVQRYWDGKDLQKYGYTKLSVRVYDKEKIAKEKEENYWKIKKEKFANGEWIPNKEDLSRLEKEKG